jgi:hypothetical protein
VIAEGYIPASSHGPEPGMLSHENGAGAKARVSRLPDALHPE